MYCCSAATDLALVTDETSPTMHPKDSEDTSNWDFKGVANVDLNKQDDKDDVKEPRATTLCFCVPKLQSLSQLQLLQQYSVKILKTFQIQISRVMITIYPVLINGILNLRWGGYRAR